MVRDSRRDLIRAGLVQLGIDRLALTVHEAAMPSRPGTDVGRGSANTHGAFDVFEYAADEGFDTIQLGPQGMTSADNPSPYDATLFARSPLGISVEGLVEAGLIDDGAVELPDAGLSRSRVQYRKAWHTQWSLLRDAHRRLPESTRHMESVAAFRAANPWLDATMLFEALASEHGTDDWTAWPRADRERPHEHGNAGSARSRALLSRPEADFAAFCQWMAHREHDRLRGRLRDIGMQVFGDLQIGISHRDAWSAQGLFLAGYKMGAPPSHTNPAGQPWGYPVLHPALLQADGQRPAGPALRFLSARFEKLFSEYDGIRIDHPHGLVCPWVYHDESGDAFAAVQAGARLFDSPAVAGHEELAAFAIPRPEQINAAVPAHHDSRVLHLEPAQIDRYAAVFDTLLAAAARPGFSAASIACEVLSTCPVPLRSVLDRHGLGRFRVTQKADPANDKHPYRTASASATDWVMAGTHDTPPLASVAEAFPPDRRRAWEAYLCQRGLEPLTAPGAAHIEPADLTQALFADLFLGPARHVQVFFVDWLGLDCVYNRPGEVHADNWMLRIERDFRARHRTAIDRGRGLSISRSVATALRARARGSEGDATDLAAALERLA